MASHLSHLSVRELLVDFKDLVVGVLPEVLERRTDVRLKSDGSPVTQGDVFLEERLRSLAIERLGEVDFVGEESYLKSSTSSAQWTVVVDPIDGTENFTSGLKIWGTSVSIWKNSQHYGSLILLPELGESLMTGDRIKLSRSRISGFSSSLNEDLVHAVVESGEARIFGCAVYNLLNVIRGSYKSFVNPVGAKSWDLIGGLQLALEHGCKVKVNDELYSGGYLEPAGKYRFEIYR